MKLFSLLFAVPFALALPFLETKGEVIPGKWIIVMKEGYDSSAASTKRSASVESLVAPRHVFNMGKFNAYAADASDDIMKKISQLDDVAYIEPDVMVRATATTSEASAPWGLARISNKDINATNYVYDESAGEGSTIYIIDSGVYTEHPDFEGRATWGPSFVANDTNPMVDEFGHGTHVAGIAGSKTYGVAKKANIIAVKVLDANGSGPISQVMAGLQWALNDTISKNSTQKSVVNFSLTTIYVGGNSTLSLAAGAAVEQGLFIAAAGGNSYSPAENFSPAQYPTVCTIGASAEDNSRPSWSNYGDAVDLFAPGVDVISTYTNGSTAYMSGTSMAAPHITGLGAYLLALEGERDPVALCARMQELAVKNIITDSMSTNNMLAFNGATGTA